MGRISAGILQGVAIFFSATCVWADWNGTVDASRPLNWYRFDEVSGPIIDYGSQGLNGTYGVGSSSPERGVAGLIGQAARFAGNSHHILFNGSPINGDWTAEFVLKKTGTGASRVLLRGAPLESPSTHLKLDQYPSTGELGYTQSFVADYRFNPGVVAPMGEYINLVWVKNNFGVKVYINGDFKSSNNVPIALNRYQLGDSSPESPRAIIDEMVIYDRALSPEEIAIHYNSVPGSPPVCGDFDLDHDVDSSDVLTFLSNWTGSLEQGVGSSSFGGGDCDGDRDVDSADLASFLQEWTGVPLVQDSASGDTRDLLSVPEPYSSFAMLWGIPAMILACRAPRRSSGTR